MSDTDRNAEEQSDYVYADTDTQFDAEEALDEERRFQQELEEEVAAENHYNEMNDNTYDEQFFAAGYERADDDEIVMCGEAREETGLDCTIPSDLWPSILEVTFDEDQQTYVVVT